MSRKAKRSKALFAAVFAALVALGCSGISVTPTAGVQPTAYAPAPAVPTEPSDDGVVEGVAAVESIDILILESFPVQVQVVARGNLPDGCTTLNEVTVERTGNSFQVTITTVRPVGMACTEALVPFEKVIPLDVYGLPAGTYTVIVNGVGGSFELAVDNVPAPEPSVAPAPATLGGKVWHDLCAVPYESVDEPPEGCVQLPDGGLVANGAMEAGEPGIEGVQVALGAGACPSTGLAGALTGANGMYTFAGLDPGTYCVSVNALDATNETILIPGGWTFPNAEGQATVVVGVGESALGVNFGWDYQFLPSP
jgi:hypothetical protein